MSEPKMYYINIESRPNGYADIYIDGVFKERFEGKTAIADAAKRIDELRMEEGKKEASVK